MSPMSGRAMVFPGQKAVNLLLLVVGTFMDMTPAILIFTPILLPTVVGVILLFGTALPTEAALPLKRKRCGALVPASFRP